MKHTLKHTLKCTLKYTLKLADTTSSHVASLKQNRPIGMALTNYVHLT